MLMCSLFIYKMQVLQPIPKEILQQIDKVFEDFFWSGKKSKISLNILKCDKRTGGLGLVDIAKRQKSLYMTWIQMTQDIETCNHLAKFFLGDDVSKNLMWKYNLNPRDAGINYGNETFWHHVLLTWCEFNHHNPISYESILKQIIWMNSHIKAKSQVLKCLPGFPKGLRIEDVVQNNKFLTANEFAIKTGRKINWLHYETVIKSIPSDWKKAIIDLVKNKDGCDVKFEWLMSVKKASKNVYSQLNKREDATSKSAKYWSQKCENFSIDTHVKAFRNLYKVTNVTKLRNFQCRLLHNKIFCNNILVHWGKVKSPNCETCNETKQDIKHLLYDCVNSRKIWKSIEELFNNMDIDTAINFEMVLYNSVMEQPGHLANFIILIAKFVIYRSKCARIKCTYNTVEKEIQIFYKIESFIAQKNCHTMKHIKKWSPYINHYNL